MTYKKTFFLTFINFFLFVFINKDTYYGSNSVLITSYYIPNCKNFTIPILPDTSLQITHKTPEIYNERYFFIPYKDQFKEKKLKDILGKKIHKKNTIFAIFLGRGLMDSFIKIDTPKPVSRREYIIIDITGFSLHTSNEFFYFQDINSYFANKLKKLSKIEKQISQFFGTLEKIKIFYFNVFNMKNNAMTAGLIHESIAEVEYKDIQSEQQKKLIISGFENFDNMSISTIYSNQDESFTIEIIKNLSGNEMIKKFSISPFYRGLTFFMSTGTLAAAICNILAIITGIALFKSFAVLNLYNAGNLIVTTEKTSTALLELYIKNNSTQAKNDLSAKLTSDMMLNYVKIIANLLMMNLFSSPNCSKAEYEEIFYESAKLCIPCDTSSTQTTNQFSICIVNQMQALISSRNITCD